MDLNTSGLEENLCKLLGLQPHDAERVVRSLADEWRRRGERSHAPAGVRQGVQAVRD